MTVRRSRRPRRGQALVEFALVVPILLLLLLGILDFGRAVYASHTIGNAAREAARLAIVDQNAEAVESRGEEHAVALDITVAATYWKPTPNADPTANAPCSPVIKECIAVVTVQTLYQAATPVIGGIVGQINLQAMTEMPVERGFSSAP